jgi:hypothetical protein
MNDSNAMRKRLIKYVGPVSLLAFAFNVVKFFEATLVYRPVTEDNEMEGNNTNPLEEDVVTR